MSVQSDSSHAGARQGLLLIVVASMLWGTTGVTSKVLTGLAVTTPLSIGFFRLAFSVPVLFVAAWLTLGPAMFRVARADAARMVLMGAMTALYQVCYFAAVGRIGVSAATLVTLCTAPVMVALLSVLFIGETMTRRIMVALVCALAGTALLAGGGSGGSGEGRLAGQLLACGSAFRYAVVALTTPTLAGRDHPFQTVAISFTIGALLLCAVLLRSGLSIDYPVSGWGLLIYLGVVPTAAAYALFTAGMRHTTATVASICTLLEPLTATILAWLLFGERFGFQGGVGGLLLAGAIGVLYAGSSRRQRHVEG